MIGEYLIQQLNALRQSDTLCDLDLISCTGACFPVHHVVFVCLNKKHFELAQRDRINRARHQSGGRRKMLLTQMSTQELDVLVQFMYGTPIAKRSRYEKLEGALEKLHMGYLLQEAGDFTLEYDEENSAREEVQDDQNTAREEVQDDQNTAREEVQNDQNTAREEVQDDQNTAREEVQDDQNTAREEVQDDQNTAREEVQDDQDMEEEDSKDPLRSLTVSFSFDKARSTSENVASQSDRYELLPGSAASCEVELRAPEACDDNQSCDTGAAESKADHVDNSGINSPPIEENVTDIGNMIVDAVKQEPVDVGQNLVPDSDSHDSSLCNIDIKPDCGQSETISCLSSSVDGGQTQWKNDKAMFGTSTPDSASAVDVLRAALSRDSHSQNQIKTQNTPNRCIIEMLESGAQARLSDTDNMNSSVGKVIDNARDMNSSQTGHLQNSKKNVSSKDDMTLTATDSISKKLSGLVATKTSLTEHDANLQSSKNNQQHSRPREATSCHKKLLPLDLNVADDSKDREATCDNSVQNTPVIPHTKQISSSMPPLGLSPGSILPPSKLVPDSVFSEKPPAYLIISPRKQAKVSHQLNHIDEACLNQVMERTESLLKKQRMLLPKPQSPSKATCGDGASTHAETDKCSNTVTTNVVSNVNVCASTHVETNKCPNAVTTNVVSNVNICASTHVETNKCPNAATTNVVSNVNIESDHLDQQSTCASREILPLYGDSSEGGISQTTIQTNSSVEVVKPVHAPVSLAQSEKVLAVLAKLSPILQQTKEKETSPSVQRKRLQKTSKKAMSRDEVLSSKEGSLLSSSSPNTRPDNPFPVLKKMLSPAVVRQRDILLDLPVSQSSTPAKQTEDNSFLCKCTGAHSSGKKRKQTCTCDSIASSCRSETMPQKRRKSIITMHLKQSPESEDENVPLSRLLQKLNGYSPISSSDTRDSKGDILLNVEEGSVPGVTEDLVGQISLTEDNEQCQSSVDDNDTHKNTSQENTENASFFDDSVLSSEQCSLDETESSKKLASELAADADPEGDLDTHTQQEDQMVDLTTDEGSNLTLDLSNVGIPNVIIETPVMRRESLAIRSPELARLLSESVNMVRLGKGGKKKRQYQSKKKQYTAKDMSSSLKVKKKKIHMATEGHTQNFQLHMSNFRTIYPKPSCPYSVSDSNNVEKATEGRDETETNHLDQVCQLYRVNSNSGFSALGTQKISPEFIINQSTSLDHCQKIKKIKMNKRVLDHRKSSKGASGLSKHGPVKKRQSNCDGETPSVSTAVIAKQEAGHKEMLTNTENEPTSGNIVVCDVQMNEKICKKKLM